MSSATHPSRKHKDALLDGCRAFVKECNSANMYRPRIDRCVSNTVLSSKALIQPAEGTALYQICSSLTDNEASSLETMDFQWVLLWVHKLSRMIRLTVEYEFMELLFQKSNVRSCAWRFQMRGSLWRKMRWCFLIEGVEWHHQEFGDPVLFFSLLPRGEQRKPSPW